MKLEELLQEMVNRSASDVFIEAGLPLTFQEEGQQVRIDTAPFTSIDTEALITEVYSLARRSMEPFIQAHNHDDDFSFSLPGVGRFRVNVFRQRGSLGAVIRVIPFSLPTADELNIPEPIMRLSQLRRGLVLYARLLGRPHQP